MKKTIIPVAMLATTLLLAGSCTGGQSLLGATGTTSQTTTSTVGTALESFLGSVLSSTTTLKQSDLVGTWNYTGTDCVFETENLLMKAGGEVAAAKVESQINSALSKVGVSAGKCSFTFNSDNTYTAVVGGRTISGTYTLDAANKKVTMTYLNGLGTMTPQVAKAGNKLSLLFDADKLLKLLTTVSALSGNSSIQTVSSLLSSYDGMLIGLQLQK